MHYQPFLLRSWAKGRKSLLCLFKPPIHPFALPLRPSFLPTSPHTSDVCSIIVVSRGVVLCVWYLTVAVLYSEGVAEKPSPAIACTVVQVDVT